MDNYDMITDLFKDPIIRKDLDDYASKLYNHEIRDLREINEMIAFYGNMILEKLGSDYTLKTTRYNEKIYTTHKLDEYSTFDFYLRNSDFSYTLVVDKADYFDHENLEDYAWSFRSHLRTYIEKTVNQISPETAFMADAPLFHPITETKRQ